MQQLGAIDSRADDAVPDSCSRAAYPFHMPPGLEFGHSAVQPKGFRKFAVNVFIGDRGQISPVLYASWYGDSLKTNLGQRGRAVVDSIDFCVTLNENTR